MAAPESHSSMVDHDEAFRAYYARHLQPLEDQFETLRVEAVTQRNQRAVCAAVAWCSALGGICYLAHPVGEFWPFFAFFGLVTAVGLGMWAWLPGAAHHLRLQDQILSRIVPYFGDLRYQQEPELRPAAYSAWLVLPHFTKVYAEDEISGSYRGVPLKLAEIKLQVASSRSASSTNSTYNAFDGLMVVFELGISFPGVTLFRTRGSNMGGSFRLNETLKQIGADDRFEAFGTEDAPGDKFPLARYFQQFTAIADQFQAKQLFASFHDRQLVLLIDKKHNFFEMSHRKETNFARDAERIRDELSYFFSIVDLLSLEVAAPEMERTSSSEELSFPAIPSLMDLRKQDAYDIGGWGCLTGFLLMGVGVAAHLVLLDPALPHGARLGYAAIGGFLSGIGVYQVGRGIVGLSISKVVWGLLILSAAGAWLFRHLPK